MLSPSTTRTLVTSTGPLPLGGTPSGIWRRASPTANPSPTTIERVANAHERRRRSIFGDPYRAEQSAALGVGSQSAALGVNVATLRLASVAAGEEDVAV